MTSLIRSISILFFGIILLFSTPYQAAFGVTVAPGPSHPGVDFDYAPTVHFDRVDFKWKMWWCGPSTLQGQARDAIYYAWSYDLVGWSTPAKVFEGTGDNRPDDPAVVDWDGGHACDPVVLRNLQIDGVNYNYILYYTGLRYWTDFEGKIGIATSNNGTSWTRYGSDPLDLICNNASASEYGCVHMSVVYLDSPVAGADRFVAIVNNAVNNGNLAGTYYIESTNGFDWTGPNRGPD